MIRSLLPPVRRSVPLRRTAGAAGLARLQSLFPGWTVHCLQSGTQALALALRALREQAFTASPEAIIPAYGCPDLVSACLHAGVRPRLVDVCGDAWGYDLEGLRAALTTGTVAVVAVDLLGVGDDAAAIRGVSGTALVHDRAQNAPLGPTSWTGDLVVLSFGRGKPINLMGGGALCVRTAHAVSPAWIAPADASLVARMRFSRAAAGVFNCITTPSLYGLVSRLPGLGVGKTEYHELTGIRAASPGWLSLLEPGIDAYVAEPDAVLAAWRTRVPAWERLGIRELRARDQASTPGRRLRLPLLAASRAQRDRLVSALLARGMGASPMYGASLEKIAGVPDIVRAQGPFPNAAELADRLFTLPTHLSVTPGDIESAARCIETTA